MRVPFPFMPAGAGTGEEQHEWPVQCDGGAGVSRERRRSMRAGILSTQAITSKFTDRQVTDHGEWFSA